jgi:predicted amidohydrolase
MSDETVIRAEIELEELRAYRAKFPALGDVRLAP